MRHEHENSSDDEQLVSAHPIDYDHGHDDGSHVDDPSDAGGQDRGALPEADGPKDEWGVEYDRRDARHLLDEMGSIRALHDAAQRASCSLRHVACSDHVVELGVDVVRASYFPKHLSGLLERVVRWIRLVGVSGWNREPNVKIATGNIANPIEIRYPKS
ncbi:hypothetical protein OPV22_003144 [Ensete ventricosum]|uniref:Uncharacterized protein n=1 Tax=Ensete ventricosum TaxID=4639 RepID=A0AAV8S044_ENSVE|nr:hypothetical protein OPV22_003144 [Ensete ventricosum]